MTATVQHKDGTTTEHDFAAPSSAPGVIGAIWESGPSTYRLTHNFECTDGSYIVAFELVALHATDIHGNRLKESAHD